MTVIDPQTFLIGTQASPWHVFDEEMRIVTIEELAEEVKPRIKDGVKRIVLAASWSGVAPNPYTKSLAQKLSDALNGFPVDGSDGFVWLSKKGTSRTTHQASTVIGKCPYGIHEGDEIMVSLAAGWPVVFEKEINEKNDPYPILRVGVAWEIYMLCLGQALQSYETAARLSNPIAAYNAAIIHLERGQDGDFEEAGRLLREAVAHGDTKAQKLLNNMGKKGH